MDAVKNWEPKVGYIVAVNYAYNGSGIGLSYEAEIVLVGGAHVLVRSRASSIHADYGRFDKLAGLVMVPLADDTVWVPRESVRMIGTPPPLASFNFAD